MSIKTKKACKIGRKMSVLRSRKAFLFTLSILLVGLAILSYTKFMLEQSESEKTLFQTAAISNRLNDIDNSLQRSIRDIFFIYSNINVSLENSTLSFKEPLPSSAGAFEYAMSRLKEMAEANETSISININSTSAELPLNILPYNTSYRHNFSNNEIIISMQQPANATLQKYKTTITADENMTCSWNFLPGNFNYELKVISPGDSDCNLDNDKLVDVGSNITITVSSKSDSRNKITISLSSSSFRIKMDNSSIFSAGIKNELYFKSIPQEVWLGGMPIDIDFSEYRVSKKGGVRII